MPCADAPAPQSTIALVAHRPAGDPQGRVHAGGHDRSRALNVVVERAQAVAKARELGDRVGFQEVFPLQDGRGCTRITASTKRSMKS